MRSTLSLLLVLLVLALSPAVSLGHLEAAVIAQEDAGGTGGGDVPPGLPVLWDELWGLKDLVLSLKAAEVGQRQAQRSVESQLRDREVEAEQLRRILGGLQETLVQQGEELRSANVRTEADRKVLTELDSGLRRRVEELDSGLRRRVEELEERSRERDEAVDELRRRSSALAAELPFLQTRLRASESTLDQLRRKSAVLAERLCNAESVMEELSKQNSVFQGNISSERLDELNTHTHVQSRLTDGLVNATELEVRLQDFQTEHAEAERIGGGALRSVSGELAALGERLNATEQRMDERINRNAERLTAAQSHAGELQLRLSAAEASVLQLKTENEAQTSLLTHISSRLDVSERHGLLVPGLEVRLRVSEDQLEHLKSEHAGLEGRRRVSEDQLEDLTTELSVLSFRLNEADDRLQELRTTNADGLKVAFSAGLTDSGSVGPFDEETTLIFSKIITNVGQAYNQTAGVFTAPVRGLYFFSFTAADFLKGYMGLYLYRNNQPIIFNLDLNDHGGYASTSNGVTLQLEEGDGVRLGLPASYRLYDDSRNFSVFSGFLLFPL